MFLVCSVFKTPGWRGLWMDGGSQSSAMGLQNEMVNNPNNPDIHSYDNPANPAKRTERNGLSNSLLFYFIYVLCMCI